MSTVTKGRRSRSGRWIYAPATGKLTCSEDMLRIFGFDPEAGVPTNEQFDERVHPDDRDRHAEAVTRALRDNVEYVDNYRIVLPDGTVKYIRESCRPVTSASGEVELVGTSVEVRERKR